MGWHEGVKAELLGVQGMTSGSESAGIYWSIVLAKRRPLAEAEAPDVCVFVSSLGEPYRKNTRVRRMKIGIRMAMLHFIYPKKEGMAIPASSAMDLTMKLGALPM